MEKNLSTYNKAIDLLFNRFPSIGLMVQSSKETYVLEEAIPEIDLDKIEVFYFLSAISVKKAVVF